jgi:predicted RNase H-like HicB family nuclease
MSELCIEGEASTTRPHYSRYTPEPSKTQLRSSYRVLLEKGQNGWIIAKCLDVRGAISQGKSRDEALRNIVEAISAILEDISEGREIPEFVVTWEEK